MCSVLVLCLICIAIIYLIYFDVDETVSVIKDVDLVELPSTLEVRSNCHFKIKKVFKGRVVTFGKFIIY